MNEERQILTKHINPPIPFPNFRWVAFREGDEETGPFYWGVTEQGAIKELKTNEHV